MSDRAEVIGEKCRDYRFICSSPCEILSLYFFARFFSKISCYSTNKVGDKVFTLFFFFFLHNFPDQNFCNYYRVSSKRLADRSPLSFLC